jgi:hypothetical protein
MCHVSFRRLSFRDPKYILYLQEKEIAMNWIFETYSNVYNTAMMQDVRALNARKEAPKALKESAFSKFLPLSSRS